MTINKRVLINPLIAVSVTTQADLIKDLIQKKGYDCEYTGMITHFDLKEERNVAFMWFTLATLRFIGDAVAPFIYNQQMTHKPAIVYVTVEGIPSKAHTQGSNIPKLEFIANSEFTKSCLEKANFNVIDVCHHAVDWEKCQILKKESVTLRKKWESEFGKRAKIIYVGRNDPRKGVDKLTSAIKLFNEHMKEDAVFLLYTDGDLKEVLKLANVVQIGTVGGLPHDQVMRMIGASDFLVFPSICEGFGVPLLEANAMGIPAIHAWFPPLSEFSSKRFNFVFGHQNEALVNQSNLQYWHFHEYRPVLLNEIMQDAVRIFKGSKKEYNEYCKLALEHSKKWDYKVIYDKLIRRLKL